MNSACRIGHNDLRLFLRHKSNYVWLFGIPLLFVYFIGLANRGSDGPVPPNPRVAIENTDRGPLGALLCRMLEGQGLRIAGPNEPRARMAQIRIQPDLTSKIMDLEQAKVELVYPPNYSDAHATILKARLLRALITINGLLIQAAMDQGPTFTAEHVLEVAARPDTVTLDARFAGRRPVPAGFYFSLPGTTVMYLIMNLLIFGGSTLAQDRRSAVIKRLAAWPVSRCQLVLGKVYGLILLGIVQIAFLLLAGRVLFGVRIGSSLPGVVLVLGALAWVAGSMGVLVGSISARQDRIAGICVCMGLLMAALGGCWWPLEVAPPVLQRAAMLVPTGWAMSALHQLISLGNGIAQVWTHIAVLAGFGAGANLLAARSFRV